MDTNDRELTPTARKLITLLEDGGGATDTANAVLASELGVGTAAVKTALRRLEDGGHITVDRRRRNWHLGDTTGRTIRLVVAS